MPLRPIDAIFVYPEQRLCVVYFRGELWALPRMKVDNAAWQRRVPFEGDKNELYLSRQQAISDPLLAKELRTLNLPEAVRGSTLPKFEAWWQAHGFKWLKDLLDEGQSPLAAHAPLSKNTQRIASILANSKEQQATASKEQTKKIADTPLANTDTNPQLSTHTAQDKQLPSLPEDSKAERSVNNEASDTDIFADMLAELTEEVLSQRY